MSNILRNTTIYFLLILSSPSLYATVLPIPFDNRISNSSQIIIARAISSESYWNADHTNIYTSITMEVTAYLKDANTTTTFGLIIPGGEVGGDLEVVTPNVSIDIGKEYLLMLENANSNSLKPNKNGTALKKNQFQLYAHVQGALKYENGQYFDFLEHEPMDEALMMDKVKKITGKTAKTPNGVTYSPRVVVKNIDKNDACLLLECDDNDPVHPLPVGTPCDDGNPNTVRDIILADGYSCAGVAANPQDAETEERPQSITLKNVAGEINPVFFTGSIEEVDELIIEGSGFGTSPGFIEFPNSDYGGQTLTTIDYASDISSWTDTRIRVKIPTQAGTGNVLIKNSAGLTIGSAPIQISYAINTLYSSFRSFESKTRQNIKFTNRNEAGGYTIQINTTTGFAASSAILPFEKAMDAWICASGVNWQLDKSGTTDGFANDGNCVVLYEPNLPNGILGITTSRYKASGNSSCNFHNTVWYLKEFDIQFALNESLGSFSWNFGPSSPQINQYDFQSIATHELGHAHGLGHVIDKDEIMHYSIENGVEKRTITTHAHNGSNTKIDIGTQPNCISSHEPMTLLQPTDCMELVQEKNTSARIKLMLQGYYNTNTNSLITNLLDNNLLPNEAPFNTVQTVSVSSFPANVVDWLLVELRDENDMQTVVAQKCVFINNTGSLVDITGNDLLTFENLDDKNYYIAIFHKSHLPIISSTAQPLSDNPPLFDFATSAATTMGDNQQTEIGGQYFMSSGDFDGNGIVNSLDFNLWRQAGAGVNQYSPADADGNGIINSLDFNLWKANSSKISVLSN